MSYSFVERYLEEAAVLERFTAAAACGGRGEARKRKREHAAAAEAGGNGTVAPPAPAAQLQSAVATRGLFVPRASCAEPSEA